MNSLIRLTGFIVLGILSFSFLGAAIAGDGGAILFAGIAGGLFAYFLPAIIAYSRRVPSSNAIFVLNIFLGWTFIGWIVAIVWSLKNYKYSAQSTSINLYQSKDVNLNNNKLSGSYPQKVLDSSDGLTLFDKKNKLFYNNKDEFLRIKNILNQLEIEGFSLDNIDFKQSIFNESEICLKGIDDDGVTDVIATFKINTDKNWMPLFLNEDYILDENPYELIELIKVNQVNKQSSISDNKNIKPIPKPDLKEKLEVLKELVEGGLLSEEDYQRKKEELLDSF